MLVDIDSFSLLIRMYSSISTSFTYVSSLPALKVVIIQTHTKIVMYFILMLHSDDLRSLFGAQTSRSNFHAIMFVGESLTNSADATYPPPPTP